MKKHKFVSIVSIFIVLAVFFSGYYFYDIKAKLINLKDYFSNEEIKSLAPVKIQENGINIDFNYNDYFTLKYPQDWVVDSYGADDNSSFTVSITSKETIDENNTDLGWWALDKNDFGLNVSKYSSTDLNDFAADFVVAYPDNKRYIGSEFKSDNLRKEEMKILRTRQIDGEIAYEIEFKGYPNGGLVVSRYLYIEHNNDVYTIQSFVWHGINGEIAFNEKLFNQLVSTFKFTN